MPLPTVSIVVATHNRASSLNALMGALRRLDYPTDLSEVIIVDDGSSPAASVDGHGLNVRVIRQAHTGPAAARNAGIRAATGELVALTDDDCRPRLDWLSTLVQRYRLFPDALLGGRTENILTENLYSTTSQILVHYLYKALAEKSSPNHFFTTSNVCGSRDRFLAIGAFDESFPLPAAEDRDLCDRWTGRLEYVPEAIVDHEHTMSFSGFATQQFSYGRGARQLHTRRFQRGHSHRIEGPSFYWRLLTYPFRSNEDRNPFVLSSLLLASQVFNTAGYLFEAINTSIRQ